MKKLINKVLNQVGYEMRSLHTKTVGSYKRPVGRMDFLLEDLKHRGLSCQAILDVGANQAKWSRMAKKVFPTAKFSLIEPQLEMRKSLDHFCKDYPGSEYFLLGAGSNKEVRTLTIWDDLAGSSFLPASNDKLKREGKQRDIDITTVDELIETGKIELPELIKLDIQGFELQALKGAKKTFGYTEVYILEVSLFSFTDVPGMPEFFEVVDFMHQRNYLVYDFPGFLRRPLDGALGQCDICFVKRDGVLRKSNDWA